MAGNWKMHKNVGEAKELAQALVERTRGASDREVLLCPPFTALPAVAEVLNGSHISLGAQNMHWEASGAFTGEVSGQMLRDVGCDYVIIGHSERRHIFAESDGVLNRKVRAALGVGLRPIFCVGETLEERDAGRQEEVVERQIRTGLAELTADQVRGLVIAYEPVWAIGTGRTATPEVAETMHRYVRSLLGDIWGEPAAVAVRIQYGGSVKPDNVDVLMAQPDIDGALVGGASLVADAFGRIVLFRAS
jgi:triosephosphate isomerase